MRVFLNILGVPSIPVSVSLIGFLLMPHNTATGGGLAWFMILTVVTGGLFLIFALLNFALTIRIIRVFFARFF